MENKKNVTIDTDIQFNKSVHFWGRLTVALGFLLSLSIPMYLSFALGYSVDFTAVFKGLTFVASFVGILWFIEPISYFPILGSSGTYMSFLSGNIGNMRMPAVGAVQNALQLEAGTKKLEIASIFALVSSVFVNLAVLLVVVISGRAVVAALPPAALGAFVYAVPGIFGAMTVSFATRMKKKHIGMVMGLGIVVILVIMYIGKVNPKIGTPLSLGQIGIASIIAIIFGYFTAKNEK